MLVLTWPATQTDTVFPGPASSAKAEAEVDDSSPLNMDLSVFLAFSFRLFFLKENLGFSLLDAPPLLAGASRERDKADRLASLLEEQNMVSPASVSVPAPDAKVVQAHEEIAQAKEEHGAAESTRKMLAHKCASLEKISNNLHKQVETQKESIAKLQEELTTSKEQFVTAHTELSGTYLLLEPPHKQNSYLQYIQPRRKAAS